MTDRASAGAFREGRPFCVYNMQKAANYVNKYKNLRNIRKRS